MIASWFSDLPFIVKLAVELWAGAVVLGFTVWIVLAGIFGGVIFGEARRAKKADAAARKLRLARSAGRRV